jgi:riboflavin synthase
VFTGLVQEVGTVRSLAHALGGARVRISSRLAEEIASGESVLVNGVCLTATSVGEGSFEADLSPETVRRSALGELGENARVNLELALRLQDRLGGHMVQGHVDDVAEVLSVNGEGDAVNMRFSAAPRLLRYVVEKGSITVDGVSLTVTAVDEEGFSVSLIPETLERTNLGEATPGRRVNLEVDLVAKYLEKLANRQ